VLDINKKPVIPAGPPNEPKGKTIAVSETLKTYGSDPNRKMNGKINTSVIERNAQPNKKLEFKPGKPFPHGSYPRKFR